MRSNKVFDVIILTFILLVLTSRVGVVKSSDEKVATFKREALKTWNEQFANVDKFSCSKTASSSSEGTPIYRYEYAVCFPSNVIERFEGDNISVECNNEMYSFSLLKESDGTGWKISNVRRNQNSLNRKKDWSFKGLYDYKDEEITLGLDRMEKMSSVWLRLYPMISLPFLFQEKDFIIDNVEEYANDDGTDIVKFDFTYALDNKNNHMGIDRGTIELNKQNYSLLRATHSIAGNSRDQTEIVVEYDQQKESPFPMVKKRRLSIVSDGEVSYSEEVNYDFCFDPTLSEDRFKLSYYGFEEPVFENDVNFDTRWYFLIVGLAFIVVAALLGRLRKRVLDVVASDNKTSG